MLTNRYVLLSYFALQYNCDWLIDQHPNKHMNHQLMPQYSHANSHCQLTSHGRVFSSLSCANSTIGQKLRVNHGGISHNCYTWKLLILHAQTY